MHNNNYMNAVAKPCSKTDDFFVNMLIEAQLSQDSRLSTYSDGCYCPGKVVTYECTVALDGGEGGSTIWRGGAFHCQNGAAMEFSLFHYRYSLPEGVSQSCNDGAIVGRSVEVENDTNSLSYTSQLDVELTSDLLSTWIECVYDNGTEETVVGSLNIMAGI